MCTLSNINILCSLHSMCYYIYYWQDSPPCFNFYVVTRSYSSRPFLCALVYNGLHIGNKFDSCVDLTGPLPLRENHRQWNQTPDQRSVLWNLTSVGARQLPTHNRQCPGATQVTSHMIDTNNSSRSQASFHVLFHMKTVEERTLEWGYYISMTLHMQWNGSLSAGTQSSYSNPPLLSTCSAWSTL